MFATPLERAVRRQVRARLRSSEILWREYVPRRRIERWRAAGRLGYAVFMTWALMLMTAVFAVVQIGLGVLADKGPFAGKGNGPTNG